MTRKLVFLFVGVSSLALLAGGAIADDASLPQRYYSVRHDTSPPLRDILVRAAPSHERQLIQNRPGLVLPMTSPGPDRVVQTTEGPNVNASIILNFDGQGANGFAPPDTNGAIGATQYIQWVNVVYNIYNKANGAKLAGPFNGNNFWAGFGGDCQTTNSGDPMVQYDKAAGRWVVAQPDFSGTYHWCVAVSTTDDALGTYNRYAFDMGGTDFPDYPKMSVWSNAYAWTSATFTFGSFYAGPKLCVMDRAAMLNGDPAVQDCFQRPASEDRTLPSDWDGITPPPAGSPVFMLSAFSNNKLRMLKLLPDFIGTSTLTGPFDITVSAFTQLCPGTRSCIPQPAPGEGLDALSARLMYRLAYRNLGDHEALVASHTVDKGAGVAGIRWYEIRDPNGSRTVFQQGTFAVGNIDIWMPSIGMDKAGNILLLLNGSDSSTHKPSVGFTGREPGDPLGTMQKAQLVVKGTGVQTSTSNRWGDYAAVTMDPADDCTFWTTGEYIKNTGSFNWSSRIASIKFNSCN